MKPEKQAKELNTSEREIENGGICSESEKNIDASSVSARTEDDVPAAKSSERVSTACESDSRLGSRASEDKLSDEKGKDGSSQDGEKVSRDLPARDGESKPRKMESPFLSTSAGAAKSSDSFDPTNEAYEIKKAREAQEEYERANIRDKILFKERCALSRALPSTSEFKSRGTGVLYILVDEDTHMYKISMIRDQLKKHACNHYISPNTITKKHPGQLMVMWFASGDVCDAESRKDASDAKQQIYIFAAKMKEEKHIDEFVRIYEEGKEVNKRIIEEGKAK